MSMPPTPANEAERLQSLQSYNILDTATEQDFDDIVELASSICETPIALISLVDENRQWFKSHKGLPVSETERTHSFCAHAINKPEEILVVDDAHQDERFAANPLVTGFPHITFYAGVPLVTEEGYALGSLCVIDSERHQLTNKQISALKVLAKQVIDKLELRRKVVQLQKSNEQLQTVRNQLNATLDSANLGMWSIDPKLQLLEYSPNFAKIYGYEGEYPMSYEQALSRIPEAERVLLSKKIAQAIVTGSGYESFHSLRRYDNDKLVWVKAVGRIARDRDSSSAKFTGILMDVTESVLATQKIENLNAQLNISNAILTEREQALQLTIQSANLGTWSIDAKTREFKPSTRLKELFGFYADEEMPYEAAVNQITDEYRQQVIDAVEAAITTRQSYDLEYPILSYHDKKIKWVRATGKLYTLPEEESGNFFGTIDDITERKQDEQRKNDFIGMVSHELKTPLTSINGYLQILLLIANKDGNAKRAGIISRALLQLKKMNSLINGFLNVTRLNSGKINIDKSTFLLDDLLLELVEEQLLINTNRKIEVDLCTNYTVDADRDKIGIVITNLIGNAIKYSPPNTSITVSCHKEDGMVKVSVADQGYGIEEHNQQKLFDRFYRVENDRTKSIGGFGIGLYLCAEIVERHGGRIAVESQPGKGSTFWFTLPVLI